MTSEIRTNSLKSRAGMSTVTMTDSGPMFSGITTFVDNSGFTFGVGGGTSIFTPATNVLTFGTNNTEKIRIDASGHMHGVGVITATHFYGDGSNLTGISGVSIANQGNNRLITATGTTDALNAEQRLTYNGSSFTNANVTNNEDSAINVYKASGDNADKAILRVGYDETNSFKVWRPRADANIYMETSQSSSDIIINTNNGSAIGERLRITSDGILLVGHTSSPTSDNDKLQVISTASGTGICLHNYSASNYGNAINFMKSRSASVGNTILQSGDRIAAFNFYGNDGSGRSLGAIIETIVDGTPSNNNTPTGIYFRTGLNQSMEQRLVITSGGDVVVGGSSLGASGTFGMQSSGHVRSVLAPNNAGSTLFGAISGVSNGFQIDIDSSNNQEYRFHDGSQQRVTIKSGKMGIGETNPISALTINEGSKGSNTTYTNAELIRLEGYDSTNSKHGIGFGRYNGGANGYKPAAFFGALTGTWSNYTNCHLTFATRNTTGDDEPTERYRITNSGKHFFGRPAGYGNISGVDADSFAYTFASASAPTHPNTNNRDTDFVEAMQIHGPVRDTTNTPALVISETGGQATGRQSLMFWNGDYNSGTGYIKSRIYTQVGGGYNYTNFYIDVAAGNRSIQQRFRIDENGTFYGSAGNNISDQRLKKDIATITDPLTKIKGLTGRSFKWNEDSTKFDDKTKFGFIAQEVETILPELVDSNGLMHFDADDKICDEFEAVSHSKSVVETGVIPITVEAIKELIIKVETLEQENIALRARVTNLEGE